MLDSQLLKKDIDSVHSALLSRGYILDSDKYQELEGMRKHTQTTLEQEQATMNKAAADMAQSKDNVELFNTQRAKLAALSAAIKKHQAALEEIQNDLDVLLSGIPNIPDTSVPLGSDESANVEIARYGEPRTYDFDVLDHVALCHKAMSFEQGVRIATSGFVVLHGELARLHRALGQWMLDTHIDRGYHEVHVPYLVNGEAMYGTSQLPKFADDQYMLPEDNLYLIPTAEVPVTNLYRDTILSVDTLPMRYVAHSACFRREAGSYGKDTRGMIRMHQFDKVELVQWVIPSEGYAAHESLTNDAELLLQLLELPYRKMLLCTGDMGFASMKTYDLEVWLPSQKTYREISSCSLFGDFQTRRMKTRYKNKDGSIQYPYVVNGSGLAVGRTLVAILENYQQSNGDVIIPEVLRSYMRGRERLLHSDIV